MRWYGEYVLKNFARVVALSCCGERIGIPEIADDEGGLGLAEIVCRRVAHDAAVALEIAADGRDRHHEAWIGGRNEAEVGDQQNRRVEILVSEGADNRAALLAPGLVENGALDRRGLVAPVGATRRHAEVARDLRQPVASGPAERCRVGMDAGATAIFPYAGVGRQRERRRAFAELFETTEEGLVAHLRQAMVDEHLLGAENDAAVDVVLRLLCGGIADAHGTLTAIALQVCRDVLVQRLARHDGMQRRQHAVGIGDRRGEVIDVGFHRLRRAEPVQRGDHEKGVA